MTERTSDNARPDAEEQSSDDERAEPVPDVAALADEIEALNEDLLTFADEVEERTVDRDRIEQELKGYVRKQIDRGHARGWGPYLVLLYGTAMTLGAFYWLRGWTSIVAMFVVWTSTLGVYALMVIFGFGIGALGLPKRLAERLRSRRS